MTAETLIKQVYAAFNARDVAGTLALMTDDVSWPKASEGGRVVGKDEIRAYWRRQWEQFDPRVEPVEILDRGNGKVDVRVHQVVKAIDGSLLADGEVWHSFTLADGLIQRMDIGESGESGEGPSAAFAKH